MSIEITPELLNDLRQNAEEASPAVVLALVAEVERLRQKSGSETDFVIKGQVK